MSFTSYCCYHKGRMRRGDYMIIRRLLSYFLLLSSGRNRMKCENWWLVFKGPWAESFSINPASLMAQLTHSRHCARNDQIWCRENRSNYRKASSCVPAVCLCVGEMQTIRRKHTASHLSLLLHTCNRIM